MMTGMQGLCKVLEEDFGQDGKRRGVVVGYDHRACAAMGLSSASFARAAAAVFLSKGFKVLLSKGMVHTPYVPFAMQCHGCVAGVMVTASHNPKQVLSTHGWRPAVATTPTHARAW
jgi:phosphomannomutase